MSVPITSEPMRLRACMRCGFNAFYFALLPFSLHWSMVLYIHSSYLGQFFTSQMVSALYIIGAMITLISFLSVTKLLNQVGTVRLATTLTIIEFCALIGMALFPSPSVALVLFIIHQAVAPLILFTLDTLLEGLIGNNESATGARRGLFLTVGSVTAALATLGMGFLVGSEDTPRFMYAYLASASLLIPFLGILLYNFVAYPHTKRPQFNILQNLTAFWQKQDVRNVFFAHFLLQLFFSWTVIYIPLYLFAHLGFNWEEIGIILFTGLLAYVFFEYLIGYLADTYFGEKEMMAFGFAILAVSISCFALLDGSSLILWMGIAFLTRTGASLVESTTESYFFKHTQDEDVSAIGVYRITQPLAFILGPILGGTLLLFFPFSFIFVILGMIMIPGLFFAMTLHDTK